MSYAQHVAVRRDIQSGIHQPLLIAAKDMGKKYVGAKLLSASVLAAFAQLTGGDAPMCLLIGDLPSRHHRSEKL